MQGSVYFEGLGNINGGEYDKVSVEGVGSCNGDIKTDEMLITGVFNCSGEIEAKRLRCEGVATIKGDILAETIDVEGVINIKTGTKIEATSIQCEGVININGQISADVIYSEGYMSAKEIVGDRIVIKTPVGLFTGFTGKRSKIDLIEATNIELRNVKAREVNGKDIIIGPKCRIELLDCSGTLKIDPSAFVEKITGDYTMMN